MTLEDKITTEFETWWESFYDTKDIIESLYKEVYGIPVFIVINNEYNLMFDE